MVVVGVFATVFGLVTLVFDVPPAYALVSLGILLLVLFSVIPWWAARTQFRDVLTTGEDRAYSFDEHGLQSSSASASGQMIWAVFKYMRETRSLYFLSMSRQMALVIPKRFFPSEVIEAEWKQLALAHLPLRQGFLSNILGRWF